MDKRIIAYIVIGIIILLLLFSSFGMINFNLNTNSNTNSENYGDMPENCRPPAGQDIESWKEHLGHHEDTLYCLEYYK